MIFPVRQRLIGLMLSVFLVGAVGLVVWGCMHGSRPRQSPDKKHSSLISELTLARLAKIEVPIDRTHLKEGLTPPTNKWFSGFALQKQPEPGYSYPNSFLPRDNGFEFSLPKITADKTIITGAHTPDVVVKIAAAAGYKVTNYDELTVELTYYDVSGHSIATVRLASGLPYVYITAKRESTLVSFSGRSVNEGTWTRIKANEANYGVSVGANNNEFLLAKNASASFFSAPTEGALGTVADHAGAIVESGKVAYERKGTDFVTTFKYVTENSRPVLFAQLPHQQTEKSNSSSVTYRSILGNMPSQVGAEFSVKTPVVPAEDSLDLSAISSDNRNLLVRQLKADIAVFEDKQDTYFAGKQLYRMAQLLMIAKQLHQDEPAEAARLVLRREFDAWLSLGKSDPKSFLYEPSMRGIVGNEASFGADKEFNDHHFHYGYFIYAAAILAKFDPDFLAAHENKINLLVADIANYNSGEKLPLRRSFDPYTGHSWASGTSPFKDGNNQESTSEAVNAWIGVALWARQIHNEALELEAEWMLSQEHYTAQMYWLLSPETAPQYLAAYTSPVVSIVWGGKREYATFFSDEANAKLAIQLLPLPPTIRRLGLSLPDELFQGTAVDQIYGDYILMAQPGATLEKAVDLPNSAIDDGNSRTYMYAYILSKR